MQENGAAPFPSGHHHRRALTVVCPQSTRTFVNVDEIFATRFALQTNDRLTNTTDTPSSSVFGSNTYSKRIGPELGPAKREVTSVAGSAHRLGLVAPYERFEDGDRPRRALVGVQRLYHVTDWSSAVPDRITNEKPVCEDNRTSLTSLICTVDAGLQG